MNKTSSAQIQKVLLTLLLCFTFVVAGTVFVGCSSPSQENNQASEEETNDSGTFEVEMRIDASAVDASFNKVVTLELLDGMTLYNALDLSGVPYDVAEGSDGIYVTSLNGLDISDAAAWTYSIDGKEGSISVDSKILESGNVITWEFGAANTATE